MATEGGGDYRQRLAARKQNRDKNKAEREKAFSSPTPPPARTKAWMGLPGSDKYPWQADNIMEAVVSAALGTGGVTLGKLMVDPERSARMAWADQAEGEPMMMNANNPRQQMLMEAAIPGGGVSGRLINEIPTPILQKATQAAAMEGKRLGAKWMEEGVEGGVRFDQGGIARAGRAGEDALFEMIEEFERIGAKPQTLTRFLKGLSKYADDPFEAMSEMGEDVGRITPGFKEALIERMMRNIGNAAQKDFF